MGRQSNVFLHRIENGAADRSCGLHGVRLAGTPKNVSDRAPAVLPELELLSKLQEQARR